MIPVILKAQPFGLDVWGRAGAAQYSWCLGMGVGFVCYLGLSAGARRANRTAPIEA
jgi:NCS1 family nucleobase:cation symporter-1